MSAPTLSSPRTHKQSSVGRVPCKFGRCSFSGTNPQVVKHEVQNHLLRRFFCSSCDKTTASFESLRTHTMRQHFRKRLFKCETCHTTYHDRARLTKCRKRHRSHWFRCPESGCIYHNARKSSVVRHMKVQHHRVADKDDIPFDNLLSNVEPPRMHRARSSSSASGLLGLPSQGPTDDELFRLSEERRRVVMELTRKEHVDLMGGETALKAAVPDYPVWTQRDHPYGRAPPVELESPKHDAETESPSLPGIPPGASLPPWSSPDLPWSPPDQPWSPPDQPWSPPDQSWASPVTPNQDSFLTASSHSIYGSQYSYDWSSQAPLFLTSLDPTFGSLGVLPQVHHVQDVKPEYGLPLYFAEWAEVPGET